MAGQGEQKKIKLMSQAEASPADVFPSQSCAKTLDWDQQNSSQWVSGEGRAWSQGFLKAGTESESYSFSMETVFKCPLLWAAGAISRLTASRQQSLFWSGH